jgi:molybdopterin converting factor subunit 1
VTVHVKLFAVLRERAGVGECAIDLPEGATVAQARGRLLERLPSLREHIDRCAYAVNRAYVRPDGILSDGDELALIPPVSGG